MNPADIRSQFFACPHLSQTQLDWVRAAGVPTVALTGDPGEGGFCIAADRVVFSGTRFDFADHLQCARDTVRALVVLARDQAGDVADIVAASPKTDQIASWLGRVCVLGEQNIWAPRIRSPALAVHSDIVGWLVAERHGVVIVDAVQAAWRLGDAGPLEVASNDEVRTLRRVLKLREPTITVRPSASEGAAL